MKRILQGFAIVVGLFLAAPAQAQNTTCATRPITDNSNACATTAFVNNYINALALPYLPITGGTLTGPLILPSFRIGTAQTDIGQLGQIYSDYSAGMLNAQTTIFRVQLGVNGSTNQEFGSGWNGANTTASAIAGIAATPNGTYNGTPANIGFPDFGVQGYGISFNTNKSSIGLGGFGIIAAAGGAAQGLNVVTQNCPFQTCGSSGGFNFHFLDDVEVDANAMLVGASQPTGDLTGFSIYAGGNATPTGVFSALKIALGTPGVTPQFKVGIETTAGAAGVGISLGAALPTGNSNSQSIFLNAIISSVAQHALIQYGSDDSFAISSSTGKNIGWNASGQLTVANITAAITVNSTSCVVSSSCTVTAAAGTLTGTTLNATVVSSSLTSVGTIGTGVWQGTLIAGQYGGTGVANTGKTITLGSSITTTGAGAPTLAFPGTSFTYTFPGASDTIILAAATQGLTNKDFTGAGNTFPTFNQNTTGSAAKWTTPRNLAGNSVDGSGNVAFSNKFIVQGTVDAGLSAAQFLGALGTGIVKNTTTTGVLSIISEGTGVEAALSANVSGSGSFCLTTSCSMTTPTLGVAAATTINKVTVTTPATGSTLTIADGKTLTASNTLTFAGTDGSTLNVGTGGTLGTAAFVATGTSGATIGLLNGNNTESGNNSHTGTETFGKGVAFTNVPTTDSSIDSSSASNQVSINTGANAVLAQAFTGMAVVVNISTGTSAIFWAGLATQTKVAGDGTWAASSTPGAGSSGFAWDGSNNFRIYNGTGTSPQIYNVFFLKTH